MKKLFVLLFLLYSSALFADIENKYLIEDIMVSRIDNDANSAREKAITKGQRDAFNLVLDRLEIDSSNGMLISDDEISQMLRSMQVKNEKITNNSYTANLMIEFSPEYVNFILKKYRITKLSSKYNSYLVVPVLEENGNTYFWEKGNRWTIPFSKNLKDNKSVMLIQNDYASKNLVDTDYFKKPTFSKFKKLADLYNVNNIVVVDAKYLKDENVIDVKIHIVSEKKTKNATLKYEMEYPDNPDLDFNNASLKIIEYLNELISKNMEINYTNHYANSKKDGSYVFAYISSLKDFDNVEKALKSDINIEKLTLKSIEKNLLIYFVEYKDNDIDSFAKSLKSDGFSVSEKNGRLYIYM